MKWMEAPGFPDYEVSNEGFVKRAKPTARGHKRFNILAGVVTRRGYRQVTLYRDFTPYTVLVHKLVCTAFNGARPEGKTMIAHNDGNPLNNKYTNLRWATSLENEQDKILHGTQAKGETGGNSKLTEKDVADIRMDQRSQRKIAADYGITQANVWSIKARKTWRHIP